MAQIVIPGPLVAVIEELPAQEQAAIFTHLSRVVRFPRSSPIRLTGDYAGRLRWFRGINWLVFYHYDSADDLVTVRAILPARLDY